MFEQERDHAAELETLTEIAREVAEILDLDELLSRIAILTKRIDRLPHVRHSAGERGDSSSSSRKWRFSTARRRAC